MSARRLLSLGLVSIAGLSMLGAACAQAAVTHNYIPGVSAKLNEGVPAEGPHGEKVPLPGPLELYGAAMTIDSGHLWLQEGARIDEFDASTGAFLSQLAHSEGPAYYGEYGIAVGHSTGEGTVYAGESVGNTLAVAAFSEAGTLEATWTGADTPAGSFGFRIGDVAVDDSTSLSDWAAGDVYVSVLGPKVVDVFRPEAGGKEKYVTQITGVSASEPFSNPLKVAVDAATGDVIVGDEAGFDVFEPNPLDQYTFVRRISGPSPSTPFKDVYNLAIDNGSGEDAGDIYITEGFAGTVIDQFSPTGEYLGRIVGGDTPAGKIQDSFAQAVDPESHDLYVADAGLGETQSPSMDVFGPTVVIPDVTTEPASNATPTGAELNGTVDPDNAGEARCQFDWGTSASFGKVAPCEPEAVPDGASAVPVHAALSGLAPDTTYFYRLQASNANATNGGEALQDQQFTTPGPAIREQSVTAVASTSATFDASIDPHKALTTYYFQYGTSSAYGAVVPAPPGEAIGSGEGDVEGAPHHVQGLQAGTLYHYRVVVLSEVTPGEVATFRGPDATFTTQTATASQLPDGRQWEMVTPPDKKGANIEPIEETGVMQAAADGGAIAYLTDGPTEPQPQGSANQVQVLSTRGPEGWATRDIAFPHTEATTKSLGEGEEYRLFSADLSRAVVQPFGSFVPGLSVEASEQTPFLRMLEGSCGSSCFRPLVTGKPGYANVPPGTVFGGYCSGIICGPFFYGATPDLDHVVVESLPALVPGAGERELYEWSNGSLALVSVLPDGEPAEGIKNGDPYVPNAFLGQEDRTASRGAISGDGTRVVWDSAGKLYQRDVARSETVQLDAAEPACVAAGRCESGGGQFQAASADGSKVFFTDKRRLTAASGNGELFPGDGDLYECEILEGAGGAPECRLLDLTPEHAGETAQVQGDVIGTSEGGEYVYFAANEALTADAVHGSCGGMSEVECNLYVYHDGATKLVAALSAEDRHDWESALSGMSARVSPDGRWLEFMAQESLTGYDNHDAVNDRLDAEVYLYNASTGRVVCASCNPTGARPLGADYKALEPGSGGLTGGPRGVWESEQWVAANVPGWLSYNLGLTASQPRYLSNSGRLFFDSGDALVPQDVNGTEDVYEYEPPGVGDCTSASATFSERSGGCVGLISAGTSAEESGFMEASEDGGDVFFLTYSKLAPQDYDNSLDIYDAHECSTAAPCFPAAVPQPPACTTAEACRAAPTPQPAAFGAPSSATFSGAGNVVASAPGASVKVKRLTRAQKLAGALRACKRKPKRRRAVCERRARKRYGGARAGKATSKKGNG
jgi:hypothetical protein